MISNLINKLKRLNVKIHVVNAKLDIQAPKGVINALLLEEIKLHKEDLINFINTYKDKKVDHLMIKPTEEKASYPMSSAQKRLWILSQIPENSIAYNMPFYKVLDGSYDIKSFKKAIHKTIDRHEILRTVFKANEEGQVAQHILSRKNLGFKVAYIDLVNADNQNAKVKEYMQADTNMVFDLENGPLFRATLIQMSQDKYIFYYNMHHIISDGWSMDVLVKDVFTYYTSFVTGSLPKLPELSIQYKDYAAWQLASENTESYKEDQAYWLDQFSGELPILELAVTKKRPLLKTNNGRRLGTYISKEVTQNLKRFCQENGGSLFMGLLANLNVLFHKYTLQEDFIIGTPMAGRDHLDLENQIGFYINTLALRNSVHPKDDFKTLFETIKSTTLKGYKHQQFPFDKLVEDLKLKRDSSRSAIFDVIMSLQNVNNNTTPRTSHTVVTDYGVTNCKFDIEVTFQEIQDHISFQITYNTDVYDQEMIDGLLRHYKQLLSSQLNTPEQRLEALHYLSSNESQQLLEEFNKTDRNVSKGCSVLDLFLKQVAEVPNKTALTCENIKMSFKTLDEKSNQIAHYLQSKGVKQGDIIPVSMDKSIEMMVGILAILKAGAAYLPIDQKYPKERINYMLKDSSARIILTQYNLATLFSEENAIEEIYVDNLNPEVATYPITKTNIVRTPNDLAYVIYTSGTTGLPKGAIVPDSGIVRLSKLSNIAIEREVTILHQSSISFDAATFEIWYALLNGGELVLYPYKEMDLKVLNQIVRDTNVNTLLFTAALFDQWALEDIEDLPLDYVLAGGDILSPKTISTIYSKIPGVKVINGYGPTENTTFTCCYEVPYATDIERAIPIGKPLIGTKVYVLNNNLSLCPINGVGELYTSGEGLFLGYLNKPELTAERLIKSPFNQNEKLYKTGDLVRWLPNGNIEFLGRADQQVKIRGYRIELGEIESQLALKESIDGVVANVIETENDKKIVAYFVSNKEETIAELREFLSNRIPKYMVPSSFVQLESIPMTTNGKVDKRALPNPKDLNLSSGIEYVAPTSDIEKSIANIWEALLERNLVGIRDDFFELGGHSITLGTLINTYQKEFNVKLNFKDLFENTTLIAHANLISDSVKLTYEEINKIPVAENYPLSDAQRRLWVLSQFNENSIAYNMPSQKVLVGNYNIEKLQKAIYATIDRHEILRTVFKENREGEIRQWVLTKEELDFNVNYFDLRDIEDQESYAKEYIQKESTSVFDLENGPLVKVSLFQLSDDTCIFYYNMHHIISDGWSLGILARDVMTYYNAYVSDSNPQLPELRIQYKDYSVWQLAQSNHESYQKNQSFWLNLLKGELPIIDLPSTKKRPVVKTNRGKRFGTYLSKKTSSDLKSFCQDRGGSLFMGLIASINALLYRYTSQEDFIIGSPVAGRDHIDLENQIGFYLNMIALRNTVNSGNDFNTLFDEVRVSVLDAYEHKQYPFDRLVEDLELQRDVSRSAIFDVVVMLQNVGEKLQESDIAKEHTNTITSLGNSISKFDIEFNFEEVGDFISFQINYNTDVYDEDIIVGFMKHYKAFLEEVLTSPNIQIGNVDYISQIEKRQLLQEFNNNKISDLHQATILDLFSNTVVTNPENIALVFGDKKMTYKELDEVSNSLANYLLSEHAIQVEDFVGIKLDRNEWLVISLLSVLKAGAAYVPIDPTYPADRMEYIEKDANCKVVIDQNLILDFEANGTQDLVASVQVKPENLAYVIYTSGSTGMPKGVMIEHRSAVSFLNNLDTQLGFKNHTVVAGTTNVVFDISFLEIFGSLCSGRQLVLFSTEQLISPELFMTHLYTHQVEVLQVTPSRLSQISEILISSPSPYLKQLLIGGEPFPKTVYDAIDAFSSLDIVNVYGPTETTIWSTSLHINSSNYLSIGKPLINEEIYILSDTLEIQPIGVVGELCISGDGLARGYLNREALTNEKFIDNPYREGSKMYKTGDLARWRSDGNIEYIRRKDDQVKIRGHRIELGEIENTLLKQEGVAQAIVLIKENDTEKCIVAYVKGKIIETDTIRLKLAAFLPSYMLPSYFVNVEAMPLNASGKIDKKALLAIDLVATSSKEYVAPRTEQEKLIVSICERILKRENISIKESFYSIGGDSLKIIQLMNQLRNEGYLVKVEQIFKTPDLEALANILVKQPTPLHIQEEYVQGVLKPKGIINEKKKYWEVGDEVQVSENQKYLMKFKNSEGFIGPFKIARRKSKTIELELRKFLSNFPALTIQFIRKEDGVYQRYVSPKEFKIAIYEKKIDRKTTLGIGEIITNEIPLIPYDFFGGELLRLFMFHKGKETYFQIAISHAIADLDSCRILKNMLGEFMGNKGVIKHPYDISNFDFAVWQQKYLISESGLEHRYFWINNLKEMHLESDSNLKTSKLKEYKYSKTKTKGIQHIEQKVVITGSRFKQVLKTAKELKVPLPGLFMGFHQYLASRFFKNAIHFQTITVTGRENVLNGFDASKVIGAINNAILLRLIPQVNNSFYTTSQEVFINYLKAREHQAIPYETIRKDFFNETKIDIDLCKTGGVNFQKIPGALDEKNSGILIKNNQILSKNHPLDIICKQRDNGIEISVVYEENTDANTQHTFKLDEILESVFNKISI